MPIIRTRSTRLRSCFMSLSWKVWGRPSPKKVMSGFDGFQYIALSTRMMAAMRGSYLHYTRSRNVIIFTICTVFVSLSFPLTLRDSARVSFPFEAPNWPALSYISNALVTSCHPAGFHVLEYLFPLDFIFTLQA